MSAVASEGLHWMMKCPDGNRTTDTGEVVLRMMGLQTGSKPGRN